MSLLKGGNFLLILIIFLFSCNNLTFSQIPFFGRCPSMPHVQNFDLERYVGRWYEIEKYFMLFEAGGKCTFVDYFTDDGFTLKSSAVMAGSLTNAVYSIDGRAKNIDSEGGGNYAVSFPIIRFLEFPYKVIATDYEEYSLIWSCFNIVIFSIRNVWILSKTRKPSGEVLRKAYQILEDQQIPLTPLRKTNQINCPDTHKINVKLS